MQSEVSTASGDQSHSRAVDELRRELAEARDQQTMTSEILGIISNSPTDVRPVFDAIARSAVHLCDALYGFVSRFDGELMHVGATHNYTPEALQEIQQVYPMRPDRSMVSGRVILTRAVVHIPDVRDDPEYSQQRLARRHGWQSVLGVPMLREGNPIGMIMVVREQAGRFSETQIKLLKTFADQAVIAIENARLLEAEQIRSSELQEALAHQTATTEVLNVISRSPTKLAPVFEAIVASAANLCGASASNIQLYDGRDLDVVATHNYTSETISLFRQMYPMAPSRSQAAGRVILSGGIIQIDDVLLDPEYSEEMAQVGGFRSILSVPMWRQGEPIGVISVSHYDPTPFTGRQIELLKTFAEQAVIAVENSRLFEAEQASKRELQESLEFQTATAEVLSVISKSPSELQPVLDAIVGTARTLCQAERSIMWRLEGDEFCAIAFSGVDSSDLERVRTQRLPTGHGSVVGRAIEARRAVHVHDVRADEDFSAIANYQMSGGLRTVLAVPLLRQGQPMGAISLARTAVAAFDDKQVALVETFADQAVIAIENTRLFEAEQASKQELRESLQYQTAISEVLSVISRSPSQIGPVMETIANTALKLCQAERAIVWRIEGDAFRPVAFSGMNVDRIEQVLEYRLPLGSGSTLGRAAQAGRAVQVLDSLSEPGLSPVNIALNRSGNIRTVFAVPLLRDGNAIGGITLSRTVVALFTDPQIALVETFADQAVIAIENTRLFEEVQARTKELTETLEHQTATGEILTSISGSITDARPVFDAIVRNLLRLFGTRFAVLQLVRNGMVEMPVADGEPGFERLAERYPRPLDGTTAGGLAMLTRRAVQFAPVLDNPTAPPGTQDFARDFGFNSVIFAPMIQGDKVIGAIGTARREAKQFDAKQLALIKAFADQAVIAIENARLFEEVQARTDELARTVEELEIASQHKNQFVANMSHELRTPLAAILGYAELIQEGFYEPQGPKSLDALTRIRSNGKHLLGLINTVLDIAKIESGQFKLNLAEYALENVVETVRAATEALAETKKLGLKTEVAKRLPIGVGDEQRLTQVLLNLVGNAIKFTDSGEVCITVTASNGHFALSVTDTGPGIPEEHQARIFEQFHQVDSTTTKVKGGTGLGLAIAKQIVEMHGGRIWVESTLGEGATFQMELPIVAENPKAMG
jgi:signal transduction histidine kinase